MNLRTTVMSLLFLGQVVWCGKNSIPVQSKNTPQKISDSIAKIILSRIALHASQPEALHSSLHTLSADLSKLLVAYGALPSKSSHHLTNQDIFTLSKL